MSTSEAPRTNIYNLERVQACPVPIATCATTQGEETDPGPTPECLMARIIVDPENWTTR